MLRVCVFVDGENFRYAIVDLFHPHLFNRADYLPGAANWAEFFDDLVARATDNEGLRVRTYWYVIDQVDPFPFIIKRAAQTPEILQDWIKRNEAILRGSGQWDDLQTGDRIAKLKRLQDSLWGERDKIRRRFEGFHVVQNSIALSSKSVEFRRSGRIGYNLLSKRLGQEKTVDVNLAVDMVLLKDNYDMALVVSGDQDYVPAVQAAKNSGKHVVNVAFQTQDGSLLPGGARRLNDITDWSISVPYDDFRQSLGL